jgi:nicotinic acid mononucleotide adenylyltransferase/nicotinamide mononucleotide (NMN) deamidase PncC
MEIKELVHQIHFSGYEFVIAITGGGTEAIGELLRYGGGSATLLEAIVPYNQQALDAFIGRKPEKYTSVRTARAMAMAAFQRAMLLQETGKKGFQHAFGIGVTCTLARPGERKERQHELHMAVQSLQKTTTCSILFSERRNREQEESLVARLIINMIGLVFDVDVTVTDGTGLSSRERPQIREVQATEAISGMLLHRDDNSDLIPTCVNVSEEVSDPQCSHKIIFSGSFDPCHRKHVEMARIAAKKYGVPVHFEISLTNVDKPPMDYISLEERISSIKACYDPDFMGDIFVTNTPLFAEKANIFPDSTFIIGADTMERLFNTKYYRPQDSTRSLFDHFKEKGVDFLVFNRKGVKIEIPAEVKTLITTVSDDEYIDNGISSTQIRKEQQDQQC